MVDSAPPSYLIPRKKITHEEFRRRRRIEEKKLQILPTSGGEQTSSNRIPTSEKSEQPTVPLRHQSPPRKISRKRPSYTSHDCAEETQGDAKRQKFNHQGKSVAKTVVESKSHERQAIRNSSGLPKKSTPVKNLELSRAKDDVKTEAKPVSNIAKGSGISHRNDDAVKQPAVPAYRRESKDDIIEITSSDDEDLDDEVRSNQLKGKGINEKVDGKYTPRNLLNRKQETSTAKAQKPSSPPNDKLPETHKVSMDVSDNGQSSHEMAMSSSSTECAKNEPRRLDRLSNSHEGFIQSCKPAVDDKLKSNIKIHASPCLGKEPKKGDTIEESTAIDPTALVCWSCLTSLENELNDGDGLNNPFIHMHPLLGVATCSICADRAYAVEVDVQSIIRANSQNEGTKDVKEMEVCSWCADADDCGTEVLFLCDNCPRAFCDQCVSIAHGSGTKGDSMVNFLSRDDTPWSCLHCRPTRILSLMRSFLTMENQTNPKNEADPKDESPENLDDKIEDLIGTLSGLEDELDETAALLEVDNVNRKRAEIQETYPEDTEDDVQGKLDAWLQVLQDKHSRCSDAIGIVQDDLENAGVDLRAFYEIRKRNLPTVETSENDWKAKADLELDRRDQELGQEKGAPLGASGWRGSDKNYRDIDELTPYELGQIEDINTAEEAMEQLERIVQKRLCDKNSKSTSSLIDERTLLNFKKSVAKDDKELKLLNCRLKFRSEKVDKKKEFNRREYLSLNREGAKMRVVCRNAKRLKSKTAKSTCKSTPSSGKPLAVVSRLSNHQVHHVLGNAGASYKNSDCILASSQSRKVAVVSALAKQLKPHQIQGIQFMWKNAFEDLASLIFRKTSHDSTSHAVRGCILAHHMGLGKSLQIVSLVHTLLTHPLLVNKCNQSKIPSRIIHRILLVVPVNTLENWKAEFRKWLVKVPKIFIYDFSSSGIGGRRDLSEQWVETGGVMLITADTLARSVKSEKNEGVLFKKIFQSPGPDLVVIDEGHMMLKNKNTEISKALFSMETSRRIVLTGTPLQNNLLEFYRMAHWIRPDCLGTEANFERKFASKIMSSLTVDASAEDQALGDQLLKEIFDTLSPYIHRLDSSVLQQDLPPIQQAVIHVRRTTAQLKLYRAFKKFQTISDSNNFLDQYSKLFPVNNHPGALLFRRKGIDRHPGETTSTSLSRNAPTNAVNGIPIRIKEENISGNESKLDYKRNLPNKQSNIDVEIVVIDDSEDENDAEESGKEVENVETFQPTLKNCDVNQSSDSNQISDSTEWWEKTSQTITNLADVQNGGKMILLLQILAHSELIGDKVVVFSQCLKTLDYIEYIIQMPDWGKMLPCLKELSEEVKVFGGWKNGRDYLRIDGQTSASERGNLIDQFNRKGEMIAMSKAYINKQAEEKAKAFLISSKAGSVGINLVAANRVVIFDSSWNPVTDQQALYRCYRYGQEKPVFAYRLLTEGSMEEKVYSRSVNKINLAARVIDQKDPKRNFTKKELSDILMMDNWAQCDNCEKWRMLPPHISLASLPEKWFCHMNHYDKDRSRCDAEEKDTDFMVRFFEEQDGIRMEGHGTTSNGAEICNDTNTHSKIRAIDKTSNDTTACKTTKGKDNCTSDDDEITLNTKRDEVLARLLKVEAPRIPRKKSKEVTELSQTSQNPLITKYFFHDSLTRDANVA